MPDNRNARSSSVQNHTPRGVLILGFAFMIGAFILSISTGRGVLTMLVLPLVVNIVGLGLVVRASWARTAAVVLTYFLTVYLSLVALNPFVELTASNQWAGLGIYGVRMILVGLSVALVFVFLPAIAVLFYLHSPEVKAAFQYRSWRGER